MQHSFYICNQYTTRTNTLTADGGLSTVVLSNLMIAALPLVYIFMSPNTRRRHHDMSMKDLLYKVKPPCDKCPYKLGLVHTVANPCPQCKENGYTMFERFQKQRLQNRDEESK